MLVHLSKKGIMLTFVKIKKKCYYTGSMVLGEISEAQLDMTEFIQFVFNFTFLAQNLPLKETIENISSDCNSSMC